MDAGWKPLAAIKSRDATKNFLLTRSNEQWAKIRSGLQAKEVKVEGNYGDRQDEHAKLANEAGHANGSNVVEDAKTPEMSPLAERDAARRQESQAVDTADSGVEGNSGGAGYHELTDVEQREKDAEDDAKQAKEKGVRRQRDSGIMHLALKTHEQEMGAIETPDEAMDALGEAGAGAELSRLAVGLGFRPKTVAEAEAARQEIGKFIYDTYRGTKDSISFAEEIHRRASSAAKAVVSESVHADAGSGGEAARTGHASEGVEAGDSPDERREIAHDIKDFSNLIKDLRESGVAPDGIAEISKSIGDAYGKKSVEAIKKKFPDLFKVSPFDKNGNGAKVEVRNRKTDKPGPKLIYDNEGTPTAQTSSGGVESSSNPSVVLRAIGDGRGGARAASEKLADFAAENSLVLHQEAFQAVASASAFFNSETSAAGKRARLITPIRRRAGL